MFFSFVQYLKILPKDLNLQCIPCLLAVDNVFNPELWEGCQPHSGPLVSSSS